MNKTLHIYLSVIGKKGGSKKGSTKRRGNAAYYRRIAALRVQKTSPSLAADREVFKKRVARMKAAKKTVRELRRVLGPIIAACEEGTGSSSSSE